MIRRDWFKRHLEILAQCLGTALGLKKRGEVRAAAASIEQALQEAFGMNGRIALGLELSNFLSLACRGEKPSAELLTSLADLFREWAALLGSAGRERESELAQARERELLALLEPEGEGR